MSEDASRGPVASRIAGRRRWLRLGRWFVITEIIVTLVIERVAFDAAGPAIWVALLAPATAYLALLWRMWRCPICHASLISDGGPYQRVVFNLAAERCARCGASLV